MKGSIMHSTGKKPVAIVGAGLAGLTAACYLRRHGVPVRLYEAGPRVAGLASSFVDADGFSCDFGAHFVTNRLAAALGMSARCRNVPRYSETVLLGRRTYAYPFGLLLSPRLLASALATRVAAMWSGGPPRSAAEWYRAKYGRALADDVAIPLTEAWSGVPAAELAPSVGDSIPGSILNTLRLKLAGRLSGRAIAIGYSREMPETSDVWHVYPTGGVGSLCEQMAAELRDVVALESPVEAIHVEAGRAVAVRVRGQDQDVAAVVSTAPVHVLARLVRGTDALQYLARFRYRPMAFVNLRLRGRGLIPDVVTWTPGKEFPFFRLTETPLSMPWLAPEGKTLLTVDIGCQVGDAVWTSPDDQLGELCLDRLAPIVPDVRQRYLGCRVLRTPIAYPVFLNEYEADRQRQERSLDVAGLYSIGRNGEFAHIFMEDVYWRTLRKMYQLLTELRRAEAGTPAEPGPPSAAGSSAELPAGTCTGAGR